MIRPSMLNRAELCGLAPVLAEKFPETGEAADKGKAIHAEIPIAWKSGKASEIPEARAAVEWIESTGIVDGGRLSFEHNVSLVDVDTMDTITEGTPDLIMEESIVTIADWKTGRAENVEDVDSNLQLISYGLAVCDGNPFRCVLVFLDGAKADAQWSRVFEPSEHAALLARVKAAASAEASARPGEHCGSCWQRRYCHAWHAREGQALALIEQDRSLTVTDDNAGQIMARAKAVKDAAEAAEAIVKAHVRNGGKCIVDGKELVISTCKGRESADVKALKEAGLNQYIKQGSAYERTAWEKAI